GAASAMPDRHTPATMPQRASRWRSRCEAGARPAQPGSRRDRPPSYHHGSGQGGSAAMSVTTGSGNLQYEALATWEQLPEGVRLIECPGVAVNSRDEVYVLTRNPENPVLVFRRDGTFLRTFGQGT